MAITVRDQEGVAVEERSVWQPDTWLLQRCWEALADHGYAREALSIANLASERNFLAPLQTLARLSRLVPLQHDLADYIDRYLQELVKEMSRTLASSPVDNRKNALASSEGLLAAATAASRIGNLSLSLAFLERLDQLPKGWEQLVTNPEQRQVLGETFAKHAPHPLFTAVLSSVLRRFGDAGALFLNEVAHHIAPRTPSSARIPALGRAPKTNTLLDACVDAFRYGMLATPQSQRLAIATYGRAGLIPELLQQSDTLANILEARRQSALDRQTDQHLVRQVKRPTANADADFQVYALTEALHSMDIRQLEREQRVTLASRLAAMARRSDGWTAASAAQTLVELGALKFATETIERIALNDPTRVEAVISLVRALLEVNEFDLAMEQVEKSLEWAENSEQGRLRKQALIRGLGEVYLNKDQPAITWRLLERANPPETGLRRLRSLFGERWTDDTLRNEALRLRALLHPDGAQLSSEPRAVTTLLTKLQSWGQQLLEGEALISFYLDSLFRPLLEAGLISQVLKLLPNVSQALLTSTGEKHTSRVKTLCILLAEQALPMALSNDATSAKTHMTDFLQTLWKNDAHRSLWQTVHGIEGSFPLLLALEGAGAVVAIAQIAPTILRIEDLGVIDGGE
ncbi:MAG: hypothetical protein U0175_14545 [Caldilineaceae bacterium]